MYTHRKWFEIQISMLGDLPSNVFTQQVKDEMVIGPHTKPAGANGGAMIESRELAQNFADALMPKYTKRYGEGVELKVVEASGRLKEKQIETMKNHNAIITTRIATGNFSPNKPVTVA